MRQEENHWSAVMYLVDLGILNECEYHPGTFLDGDESLKDYWPIVMAEKNKGNGGKVSWAKGMAAREYTDLLTKAYEDNFADTCPSCDKWMRD